MPTEIHVVVSPAGVAAAFLGLILFAAVVFLAGVAAMWPQRSQAEVDSPVAADATEPPARRPVRHTGTIHAPQYRRSESDEDTEFIELPGARY
ncbi:hypothetical protein ACGFIW_02025 [Micromonospora sp. NPDC048935]|uniref:hypothetical protein n=1 Tax=Micromonospora sp. NPDC048935 TaxID=3364262 RepID=UPI0037232637